jgi:predicted DNA-binding transcriptional regulator YafY
VLFLPGGEPSAVALGRGDEFRSARRKLEAVLSNDAARSLGDLGRWLLIAPEGWGEPAEAPPLVPHLASAASLHRVIDIDYRASGQTARRRTIRPLGLVLAGRIWYLLALKDDTGEQRTYRVDRVRSVTETGREFEASGESVREVWDRARTELRGRRALRAVVRAEPDMAPIVRFVASTVGRIVEVVDHPDGRSDIVADFDRLTAAAGILAGLGSRAEVRSPPELIDAIVEISRHNLAAYAGEGLRARRGGS